MTTTNNEFDADIERGLMWHAEKQRLFKRIEVQQQIDDAQAPWDEACTTLQKYPKVVALLNQLYPATLPYLIKGHDVSPVHHIAHVVTRMARIAVVECPSPDDVKRGVIGALLHDIGIGDAILPKITEEMIKKAPEADKPKLRKKGIKSRLEHMKKGKEIASSLLKGRDSLTEDDIEVILDIVETHDHAKIPLMEETVNKKWLLDDTKCNSWLKQCHWEADALWMLSPAGILVDLNREKESDKPENRLAKFSFNLSLHGDVVDLYRGAYSAKDFAKFDFNHGLLYRTNTGISMVYQFRSKLLSDYLPKIFQEYCPKLDESSLGETEWDYALLKMLEFPDTLAVQSAAHALGLRGNRIALMPLGLLSEHPDKKVRDAAEVAFKNLDRWTRES